MKCKSKHVFFSTQYMLYLSQKQIAIGKTKQNIKYSIPLSLQTVIKWIFNKDFTFQGFEFKRKNKWKTMLLNHDDCLLLKDYIDGKVSYLNLLKMYNIISCQRQCYSSKVYLCKCCINQLSYNLQIFPITDLNSKEYQNMIEMINIDHPNIIKFLEYFVEDSNLCVITQTLNGKTLKERINSQYKMEMNEIIYTLKALLELTLYSHQKGYVFKDLSSTNVFLTNTGEVYLIDFEVLVKVEDAFRTKAGTKDQFFDFKDSSQFNEFGWQEVEKFYHEQYDVYIVGQLLHEMLSNKVMQKTIKDKQNQLQSYSTVITTKSTKYYLYQLLRQMLETDPKVRIKPQNALYFLSDMEFEDDSYESFPDSSENQKFQVIKEFQIKTSIYK